MFVAVICWWINHTIRYEPYLLSFYLTYIACSWLVVGLFCFVVGSNFSVAACSLFVTITEQFCISVITTTLVVQVKQSGVCLCVQTITFERNHLWPIYLTCWITLTLVTSRLMMKVMYESSWWQKWWHFHWKIRYIQMSAAVIPGNARVQHASFALLRKPRMKPY